jgi:hypothetical protein
MRITVVVNSDGQVVAAHGPATSQGPPDSYAEEEARFTGFVPTEGQSVMELELPDDDVPSEPRPDFLDTLQLCKDRTTREASS